MKILITSDIHIGDYFRYNPTPSYRLLERLGLAERIKNYCLENGVKEVWILGDLIDKSVNIPSVLKVLKRFIIILHESGVKIRYILGNHDAYSRAKNLSEDDSAMLMLDEYMEYMDKKLIEIDGHTFLFSNYQRKVDMSWIKHKVDVFLTHMSIGFGQSPDVSKFRLCFYGDIHNTATVIENCISVAAPLQQKITDEPDAGFIILDTKTLKWERVKTSSDDFKPLLLKYHTEEGLGIYYNEDLKTYFIPKKIKHKVKKAFESVNTEEFEFSELLEKYLISNNLMDTHKDIVSKCSDYNPVDFNFELMDIEIHNIKGIKDLRYNFNDSLMVVGKNGKGKSSFILSIYQLLKGAMKWDRLVRRGTKESWIKGHISYQGKIFYLCRSNKTQWLKIDDVEVKYKDRNDFDKVVEKHLPFIKYSYAYYFNYWNTELFGSMNAELKIKIISRFNGLDVFDSYIKRCEQLIESYKDKLKIAQKSVDATKESVSFNSNHIKKYESQYPEFLTTKFSRVDYSIMKVNYEDLQVSVNDKKKYEKILELKNKLMNSEINLDEVNSSIDTLNKELHELDEFIDKYKSLKQVGMDYESKMKSSQSKLNRIKSSVNKCYACGGIIKPEKYNEDLKDAEEEYNSYKSLFNDTLKEFKLMRESYKSKLARRGEVEKLLKDLEAKKSTYLSNKKIWDELDLDDELDRLSSMINSKELEEELAKKKEELDDYLFKLTKYESYLDIKSALSEYENKLMDLRSKRDEYKSQLKSYQDYLVLISKNGPIYSSILDSLARSISNEMFKFRMKNGDLVAYFFNEDDQEWKIYEDCSSGQKSLIDAYFLKMIIRNIGLLVFDEYFRFVDEDYIQIISNILEEVSCNTLILSTHSMNILWDHDILNFNEVRL